jgi:aspartate/methionine/tyrosine aminotransferase
VERYLGLTRDTTEELVVEFALETKLQTEALRTNVEYVVKKLIGIQSIKWTNDIGHIWHESEDFRIYHPQGGINMLVELKVFEGVDQIDFVRKAYLATGVIFHPSIFLNHRSGLHIRVTLSQSLEALSQVLDALLYVVQRREELCFLPAGSFTLNTSMDECS